MGLKHATFVEQAIELEEHSQLFWQKHWFARVKAHVCVCVCLDVFMSSMERSMNFSRYKHARCGMY